MERQLANLTGLVQKALTQTPTPRDFLAPPGRDAYRSGKLLLYSIVSLYYNCILYKH